MSRLIDNRERERRLRGDSLLIELQGISDTEMDAQYYVAVITDLRAQIEALQAENLRLQETLKLFTSILPPPASELTKKENENGNKNLSSLRNDSRKTRDLPGLYR